VFQQNIESLSMLCQLHHALKFVNFLSLFKGFVHCDLKVAANYSFTCLLRLLSVVCPFIVVVVTDKNLNFSALRSPIELKLGGDLWLVFQINVYALVLRISRLFIFCKQTNKQKTTKIAKKAVL
jgi:hypothetical protein